MFKCFYGALLFIIFLIGGLHHFDIGILGCLVGFGLGNPSPVSFSYRLEDIHAKEVQESSLIKYHLHSNKHIWAANLVWLSTLSLLEAMTKGSVLESSVSRNIC